MNVRYKVVAISGSQRSKLECLPRELLLMIVRRLPIKYLVQAGLINRYFKELVGSTIVQDGFELAELSSFMKFRQESEISIPMELDNPISKNRMPLSVLFQNYQMVKAYMQNKPIADWITVPRGMVEWGLSEGSSYIRLNMRRPAVYGLLKVGQCDFYGAIRIRNDQLNMEYYPGKIEKKVLNMPNGMHREWFGCSIGANGKLVAGKIEKMVFRVPDRGITEWVGCEISADGIAGKIEKKVYCGPDGYVWEYHGCNVEANGKLVAGKSRRKLCGALMDTFGNGLDVR